MREEPSQDTEDFSKCTRAIAAVFFPFLIIILMMGACSQINKMCDLLDDNPAEEFVEDLIEREYGVVVDLTPDSPEKSEVISSKK